MTIPEPPTEEIIRRPDVELLAALDRRAAELDEWEQLLDARARELAIQDRDVQLREKRLLAREREVAAFVARTQVELRRREAAIYTELELR